MVDLFHKLSFMVKDDNSSHLIESIATKTAYTASGVTVVSGLTVNEWGVIVGGAAAVVTAIFNIWFKMKYQRPKAKR